MRLIMAWVYDRPLTPQEKVVQRKLLRTPEFSKAILKILSLIVFIRNHKFKSAEELHNSVFLDKKHKHHFFTIEQANEIFHTKGGGEYPMLQRIIEGAGNFLKNHDPTPISWFVASALGVIRKPTDFIKSEVGEGPYELASGVIHGLLETGVSGVNGAAADAGGPIGIAAVALFTGIAAAVGAIIASVEGDHAQAAVHAINFVPGIGPAIVKGLNKVEHLSVKIGDHRDQIANIPLIGETLLSLGPPTPEVLPTAGKRFSTMKRKHSKWKTLRKRSVTR
jgi:hypothetical protein